MKTLKKSLIASLVIGLLNVPMIVIAQTTPDSMKAAEILPSDIDIMYEFSTSEKNPFEDRLTTSILGSMVSDDAAMLEMTTAVLADNTMTLAMKMINEVVDEQGYSYAQPEMFVAFHVNAENFAILLEVTQKDMTVTEELYQNQTMYIGENDSYVAHLGDLFVMTNTKENLMTVIDAYAGKSTQTLASFSPYMQTKNRFVDGSFLNVYINPEFIAGNLATQTSSGEPLMEFFTLTMKDFEDNLLKAMLAEGFSLAQTEDGFSFGASVEGDLGKLTALDLDFDKYNFVPSLYKEISGKNLIMYEEKNNAKARLDDLFKMLNMDAEAMTEFNAWKAEFKKNSGISFENDLLPLLTGKYAVAIHRTAQIYPGATLMIDVGNQQTETANVLAKLSDYLKEEFQKMEDESGENIFQYDTTNADGTVFYTYYLDLAALSDDEEFQAIDPGMTKLVIRMAVTTDGRLIVSNNPDLNTILGGNMSDNASFDEAFTNPGESVEGLCFIGLETLHDYVTMLMETFEAPAEAKTAVDTILNPWHYLFAKTKADTDTLWVEGNVKVDVEDFAQYGEAFANLFMMGFEFEENFEMPEPIVDYSGTGFCDVKSSDWFYTYVDDLNANGILEGYEDGCFHPNNPVTRAEFTKMAYEVGVLTGNIQEEPTPTVFDQYENPFTDVPYDSSAWYVNYVGKAKMHSLVNGFTDGTFRPNAPITRAEAVQILYNMSNYLPGINVVGQPINSLIDFDDVSASDWFMVPVAAAFHYNLVDGVTPERFEPNRNITRAESAKVIKLFLNLEMQE